MKTLPRPAKRILGWILKIGIFVVAYSYICFELFVGNKWNSVQNFFHILSFSAEIILCLAIVILLMLLNWAIESYKWRFLLRHLSVITFWQSLRSVFTGVAFGCFTPWRIGDFFGRAFSLKKTDTRQTIFLSVLNNFSQLVSTVLWGATACFFFLFIPNVSVQAGISPPYHILLAALIVVFLFFIFFLFSHIPVFSVPFALRVKRYWEKAPQYASILQGYSTKDLRKTLAFSVIRHFVFTTEFSLLLYVFGSPFPFLHHYFLVCIIYFMMSAIPSFTLADIGIRGSVSLFVFKAYSYCMAAEVPNLSWVVINASIMIWILNLLIPAVVGSFFVFRIRFFKTNRELDVETVSSPPCSELMR